MTTTPASAPRAARPLLDLSTLDPVDRPFILIDAVRYEYNVPADFGIQALNRLDQMVAAVNAMQPRPDASGTLSEEDATALSAALLTVVQHVLRAPAEVIEKLTDVQRLAIVAAFTPASPAGPAKRQTPRTRPPRTGATSSRASRASTGRRTG